MSDAITQINQWTGLGISYVFIFAVIAVAQVLLRTRVLGAAATRKVVHIGVAHWWIIAMLFIDDLLVALIGPVSFILINWYSYRTHVFAAMEYSEPRKNLGTVYFPAALTALVALTWSGLFPQWYGLMAILVLGWGDGTASLVGEWLGARSPQGRFVVPGGTKSIGGTAAMFFVTGTVAAVVIWMFSGPLATVSAGISTGGPAGMWARTVATMREIGSQTWMGQPTDSTVLFALSRLDGAARLLVERATAVAPDTLTGAAGAAGVMLNPAYWAWNPTTILAAALVVAAAATAVELLTPWGLDNISVPLVVFAVVTLLLPMPTEWIVRLAWAVGLNVLVAVVAYLRHSVTATGAVTGAGVGMVIYLSGGGFYWSILMAFFASSSVIGRVTGRRGTRAERRRQAESIHAKGRRRDGVQVLANGGLAAIMAAAHALSGRPIFMLGYAITMAAATADTWASEIGVLSSRDPVSILSFRQIPRGTSGGISPLGLIASTGGALFIGLWFAVGYVVVHGWNGAELLAMVAAITGGGFLGSLLDSVLGATVQAQYWDEAGNAHTERRHTATGVPNRLVKGSHYLTNDAVNALSGALATAALFVVVVA
ncbi:MAG: DUF92 domain-containing protein [Alkalispirochaeta sp.]